MVNLFRRFLTKLEDRLNPKKPYEFTDLKDLELRIMADAMRGLLPIETRMVTTEVSIDQHVTVLNRDIHIRVDHAFIGGTFSFIWVQGMDLSQAKVTEFDYQRVITAILERKDVPTTSVSLWRC
jgi:hypothetical protein